MREEIVYNVETEDKSVDIRCNWCLQSFTFTEEKNQYVAKTNCPWCRELITIPRNRLRRINGHGARP